MDSDVHGSASTWIHLSPGRPAVTFIFDLQNLIRSSVGASRYHLLSQFFKAFMRYRGNNSCPDERTNVPPGQSENIIPSPTVRLQRH